jgi:hypothetical protein
VAPVGENAGPVELATDVLVTDCDLLAKAKDYFPSDAEAIDNWLQATNSSNVRTTAKIIKALAPQARVVVDPFVGAGSCAVAARRLDLPFYGIELDAVSAGVAAAKALGESRHADTYGIRPFGTEFSQLMATVTEYNTRFPQQAHAMSCLALLSAVRGQLGLPNNTPRIIRELRNHRSPQPANHVAWGDATEAAAWERFGRVSRPAVIYTSPPFGPSSPRFRVPRVAHGAARQIFAKQGYDRAQAEPPAFKGYTELTIGMLSQAIQHLRRATVIIEHEPGDEGEDRRHELAGQIQREFGRRVGRVRIEQSKAFSRRGRLSLIVCEIHR